MSATGVITILAVLALLGALILSARYMYTHMEPNPHAVQDEWDDLTQEMR